MGMVTIAPTKIPRKYGQPESTKIAFLDWIENHAGNLCKALYRRLRSGHLQNVSPFNDRFQPNWNRL